MWPLEIVVAQPGAERPSAPPRAGIRDGIRPAPNERLDEALGFAVGLGPIRAGARQADAGPRGTLLKDATDKKPAVIGEHALDDDAAARKPADGPREERGRGRPVLIGQDLDIGGATVIVDGDVDIFPPRAGDFGAPVAVNAVARAQNANEWLDVEMHELAGPRPLVADDGRGRLTRRQAIQALAGEDRGDRRPRHLQPHGNRPRRQALMPSRDDRADDRTRRAARLMMRCRRPIRERGIAAIAVPGEPFISRPRGNTGGAGRCGDPPL